GKYLHFDSCSSVSDKKSVVKTLFKRAETHCSTKELQKEEEKEIHSDLKNCGYSNRFIQKVRRERPKPKVEGPSLGKIFYSYAGKQGNEVKRILKSYGFEVYFKNTETCRNMLSKVKDATPKDKQAGVIYKIKCAGESCTYIGETGRNLEKRINEHHAA